jgi:hypothetical protein
MNRGELWAKNLKKKPWFRLWLYSLGLLAVLAFFSSSLMRYHWPVKPIFLFPDRVTQVKEYSLQSSHPFTIGAIDNFENRDRISKFEFNFNADKVNAAATIFDFGTNVAPVRLYVFNNQLKLLAPGGQKRSEAVQNLTLIDEIQPKKSYQVNIHIKNGTFIHISIEGKEVLDLDEPGLVSSGLLSIGSNLDGGQVFAGVINKIKIREGIKEVRTSKMFIPIFWISFFVGLVLIALDYLGITLSWSMPIKGYISKIITNTFLSIGLGMVLLGLCYYIWFFMHNEYLPTPFVYAKSETFTDYFHTLVWVHREGRYTIWNTVYPPLIFLALKMLTPNLYIDNVFALRIVAYQHIYWLMGLYILVPALVLKTRIWNDWTFAKKVLTYFAIISSAPVLFSLERGNLIFIVPLFIALALSYPNYLRKVCLAILINLKPYFIIFYFGYLIKRQWKDFLIASMVAAGIFCISGLLLDQHFYLFFYNLLGFAGSSDLFTGREVIGLPSSIGAWSYFLKSYDWFQLQLDTGFFWSPDPLLIKGIDWVKNLVLLICITFVIKARYSITLNEWFLFSVCLITNSGVSVSGYSLLLYYPLIPVILKIPKGQILIGLLVLISWPWDMIELLRNTMSNVILYFPNRNQNVEWTLGFGAIIRPFLNLLILIGVSYGIYRNSKLEKASFINSKADIA